MVFENKVLRKILAPTVDPVKGRVRVKSNVEMWRLTGQPFITGVIKFKRLQWAGHEARELPTRAIRKVLDNRSTSPRPGHKVHFVYVGRTMSLQTLAGGGCRTGDWRHRIEPHGGVLVMRQ